MRFSFAIVVIRADDKSNILLAIKTLKSSLPNLIDPDFGFLDHLRSLQVLTPRQIADVRSERTVYRRNDAVLELLTSEDQCDKFLTALQRTGQQHVVNFITHNRGQKHNVVTSVSSVKSGEEQTIMSHLFC